VLKTADRALQLLLLFEEVDQEYRVGEIATMLGIDKSVASRLAATLASKGFLKRASDNEAFRLGPELGRLGMLAVASSDNLVELAQGPMDRLAEETAETVNLARLEDGKTVNLAQVDGPFLVGVGDWIGWRTEPHTTANGKVLLAFSEDVSEGLLENLPLQAFTERTITTTEEMRVEVERIRSRGWATTLGELEEGFNGVAVPVLDGTDRCRTALSVSGPVYRMSAERLPEVAELCKRAAEDIGARLGRDA